MENELSEILSKQQGAVGALIVGLLWAGRELYRSREKKQQEHEDKIAKLEETLSETNKEILKLNLNFDNFNKYIMEKLHLVDANKKSLDLFHGKIRELAARKKND